MCFTANNLFFVSMMLCFLPTSIAFVKFTNVDCKKLSDLVTYKRCDIKAIDHYTNALYITASITQTVNNASVDVRLARKSNIGGWRTFMFDVKDVDICRFLRTSRSKRNKFYQFAAVYIKKYVNFCHMCPYMAGEEIIVERLALQELAPGIVPIDLGEYGAFIKVKVNRSPVSTVNVFITYSNYSRIW